MLAFAEKITSTHLLQGTLPKIVEAADNTNDVLKQIMTMMADEFGGNLSLNLGAWFPSKKERERRAKMDAMMAVERVHTQLGLKLEETAVGRFQQQQKMLAVAEPSGPKNNSKPSTPAQSEPKAKQKGFVQKKRKLAVAEALASAFGRTGAEVRKILSLDEAPAVEKAAPKPKKPFFLYKGGKGKK